MLLANARDLQLVLAGKLQGLSDAVFINHLYNAIDRSSVQMAGVIRKPAQLVKDNGRRFRKRNPRRLSLIGVRRENKVAFLFSTWSSSVNKYLLCADNNERGKNQNSR